MLNELFQAGWVQNFPPHGVCLLWRKELVALHVASDFFITVSYYSIPTALAFFIKKRTDFKYRWIIVLFCIFILACGTTHLMEIWTIWNPDYLAEGLIKLFTAIVSVSAAIVLWPMLPDVLSLPSPAMLEETNSRLQHEIGERLRSELQVKQLNNNLEKKVAQRTRELLSANSQLKAEIRERVQIEQSLRESEERYRTLFEQMPDSVVLLGIESDEIIGFNTNAYQNLGYTLEEFQKLRIRDINNELSDNEIKQLIEQIQDYGSAIFEVKHICKNGVIRDVRVNARLVEINQKKLIQAIWTDISEYKQLEQRLTRKRNDLELAQKRIEHILKASPSVIYSLYLTESPDSPYKTSFVSESITSMTGFEPALWKQHKNFWIDHIHPEDRAKALDNRKVLMETGELTHQYRFQHRDGSYRWIHEQERLLRDDNGVAEEVVGTWIDVTEHKQVEDALLESERINSAILSTAMDGFLIIDSHGRILDVNPAFCRLTGYTRGELVNRMSMVDFEFSHDPEQLDMQIRGILATGSDLFETRYRTKNGGLLDVEVSMILIPGTEGKFCGFVRDITERKKTEQDRLLRAEQQRDTLVREVHHRIKNNLQGVIGLLELDLFDHPQAAPVVNDIIAKIKSVAVVFGLQGTHGEDDIRLCEIITEVCKGAEKLTGAAFEPLVEWARTAPIQVDKDRAVPIALVINELVNNALKHGQVNLPQHPVLVKVSADEQCAVVMVRNNCDGTGADLDYELGIGLGTGLTLVKSLLPPEGAKLTLSLENGVMTAELRLYPPIINLIKSREAI